MEENRKQDEVARRSRVPPGKMVLIVDDEQKVLSATRDFLVSFGYQVLTASSRAEAVKIWTENKGQFDFVLLDVSLPAEGLILAQKIGSENPGVRIGFMSGYSRETLEHMGYALPPEAPFIQKPFDFDRLISILQ